MCDNAAIPLNWKSFLRLDDNKKEIFQYLAASVQSSTLSDVDVTSSTIMTRRAWHLVTTKKQIPVSSFMQSMPL